MPKSKRSSEVATTSPFAAAIAANAEKLAALHSDENPLWRGPCGEGWCGGVTQSMLSRFLSCRERFRLRYVVGLVPHDKWSHRPGYGNMWHLCEEALARGEEWEDMLNLHLGIMMEQYPLQREELVKWANVCRVQFPEYVSYWEDHPDVANRTPLMQEQVFDVPYPLPSGRTVRLRGKWDSVDLIDGGVYLQENKTKGDVDLQQIERQLTFDLQTMMYLVALKEEQKNRVGVMGNYPNGRTLIHGVRYNVVRRPLSGGKGSIIQHKATKTKPAETAEEFYERLRADYFEDDPAYWFFRVRAEISARDIEVFHHTCLDPILEQLCDWYDHITGADEWLCDVKAAPHWRTPFGIFSALEEGGSTEYDYYMATGSEVGLQRATSLFEELR